MSKNTQNQKIEKSRGFSPYIPHPIPSNRGIVTLELLIAFTLGVFLLVGATMISFAGQSAALDSRLTTHGLYRAGTHISSTNASLASSIDAWNTLASGIEDEAAAPEEAFYERIRTITDISPCVKFVGSDTNWTSEKNRGQNINFGTLVANVAVAQAFGGDCDPFPPSEWDNPGSLVSKNINGQSNATDIDAINGRLYLTTDPAGNNKDDFFVFEFDSTSNTLTEKGSFDVDPPLSEGLNAVDVAGHFAYVAAASSTAQFQVIDVDMAVPGNPKRVAKARLPGVGASHPAGISIYYYKDTVYIGTAETAGNEFHVFDVSTPDSPIHLGSKQINHSVYDIVVRDEEIDGALVRVAYLALSTTNSTASELWALDVTNPFGGINEIGRFNAVGIKHGRSLYILGQRIYLGLARNSNTDKDPNFYTLDVAAILNNVSETDGVLGTEKDPINNPILHPNTPIVGIVIKGGLAFLAMDNSTVGLRILNISDLSNIVDQSACSAFNFSENTSGIDMDNNYVFTSNKSNVEIRVIYDQSTTCTP